MTTKEIIERIARRQDVSNALAAGFVHEVIDEITRALGRGETVKIRGLGTLCWRRVQSNRMPSGQMVPAGWKLKLVPSMKLRNRRLTCRTTKE